MSTSTMSSNGGGGEGGTSMMSTKGGGTGMSMSVEAMNSSISMLVDRLTLLSRSQTRTRSDDISIFSTCLSLARGIDFAVTHNQIISKVVSRFFPWMKMGQIIVSLEAKAGYEVLVSDFLVQRTMPVASTMERIRLFVVQTDNIGTSSCIVTPKEVNFIVNGKGVAKRTNISVEAGPQSPTDVTALLKYGTNLMQVIGNFPGNHLIVIAYTSLTSSFKTGPLPDYVQPTVTEFVSDAEVIEDVSRISLKCPISCKRIITPVKGQLCKHHQCFDYDNYLKINAIKPSWRCPHCNQSVCFTDLRIDRNMVKVLKEVGEDISDVLISADGSWKFVDEHENFTSQQKNGTITGRRDGSDETESKMSSNALANVVDLTMEGTNESNLTANSAGLGSSLCLTNEMCMTYDTSETEDRKPFQDSVSENFSAVPVLNNSSDIFQEPADQLWQRSRILSLESSAKGSVSHSETATNPTTTPADAPVGIPDYSTFEAVLAQVTFDALNRGQINGHSTSQLTTALQSVAQSRQFTTPENLQLQQSQSGNSIISNFPLRRSIPRNVSRTPIAIQALPAQTQVSNLHHSRSRPNVVSSNPVVSNAASLIASQLHPHLTSTADGAGAANREMEGQQLTMSQLSPCSSSPWINTAPQIWNTLYPQNTELPHVVGLPATSLVGISVPSEPYASSDRASSDYPADHQNPYNQHASNPKVSQPLNQLGTRVKQISRRPSMHAQLQAQLPAIPWPGESSLSLQTQPTFPQHFLHMTRPTARVQASRTMPSYTTNAIDVGQSLGEQRPNLVADIIPESGESWRQSVGRMRGSLTGQSYSAALNQLLVRPTQTRSPATTPVSIGQNQAPLPFPVIDSISAQGQSQANKRTGDVGRKEG